MNCPKCENQKTQPITKDGSKRYCPDCNHSWDIDSRKNKEGSVDFSAVPDAKKFIDALIKDQEISPEIRAVIETQLISMLMDQWFDGFKGGQLASIVYARSHYDNGKTRSKSTSATGKHEGRPESSGSQASNGEDGSSEQPDHGSSSGDKRSRERVSGIDFFYPRHVKVPENVYQEAAIIGRTMENITKIDYDGRHLSVSIKV